MLETTIHPPSDAAAKRTSAAAKIEVVDQTFRDAHQCLWATRMTTAHMLPGRTTMLLTSASASGGDGAGAGRAQRGTGTSTAIDVVHGERYRYVPDEVKKYALGYYGKLLAPVDPNVLDAIVRNGSPQIAIKPV